MSMLKTVWYKIEENRTACSEEIFRALLKKEIPCRKIRESALKWRNPEETKKHTTCGMEEEDEKQGKAGAEKEKQESAEQEKGLEVILTDDRELVKRASQQQIACIGVAGAKSAFFDGADLVVENPEELELRDITEFLLRYHGLPVTIAQTKRLTLREMVADDWRALEPISRQEGMEKARRECGEDEFGKERLSAYIGSQYRLYGYGLWSVVRTESESVIGCCGFSALEEAAEPSGLVLELQYMLDEAYRRKGYGTEMCRAAISYAYEELEAKEIWVRVRADYQVALSFAHSLGFFEQNPAWKSDETRTFCENGREVRDGMDETYGGGGRILWLRHENAEQQNGRGRAEY